MTRTILAVDDEPDILLAMKGLIEEVLDIPVTLATTGLAGLRALEEKEVVLVISDFNMPGMNGLEFLAQSFRLKPDVPRVMMTAFPEMDLVLRAVNQARVTQFLLKPVHPSSLIETVRGILAERTAAMARAANPSGGTVPASPSSFSPGPGSVQ